MKFEPRLVVLVEKMRSAFNVGSVFRSCDAVGVDRLYLCGYSALPPHTKVVKTSLGSELSVPWEHHCDAILCAKMLQKQGYRLVALENAKEATNIFEANFTQDTCLIIGHEEQGVSALLLGIAQEIVAIPQYGMKNSLNASVALGVVLYEYTRKKMY
jgi:tRNA G18 (ribose-2'-O)-methylase SpoU